MRVATAIDLGRIRHTPPVVLRINIKRGVVTDRITTVTVNIIAVDNRLRITIERNTIMGAVGDDVITDGEITITVTSTVNNPALYVYSIDNGSTYQASNVFSGLDIGTYNFLIRHINTGCIITATETITDPNTFTIDVVKTNDGRCVPFVVQHIIWHKPVHPHTHTFRCREGVCCPPHGTCPPPICQCSVGPRSPFSPRRMQVIWIHKVYYNFRISSG